MTTPTEFRILTVLQLMKSLKSMEMGHLKKLAALATEVSLAKDQIIYREGDVGDALYFIEEGQVAIEMKAPDVSRWVEMYSVGPGQLFGWSALFPTRRKQARARSVVPTHVIAIHAAHLREAFVADQALENAMIQRVTEVLAERLNRTRAQLANAVNLANKV